MAHARTTFLDSHLRWIRPSLWALLVGVVTTISTVIGATSNAVPVILKTQSDFKKEGAVWREYPPNAVAYDFEFREVRRTRDEILLRNLTPRQGLADSASLVVHLPVCGGTAKLTEGLPERWTDLEEVWRGSRRG